MWFELILNSVFYINFCANFYVNFNLKTLHCVLMSGVSHMLLPPEDNFLRIENVVINK
jgi:hypothetical protein